MCGRYTITVTLEELMLRYDVYYKVPSKYSPKYNVAPGQLVMAIVYDGEKNRLGELRWGLIPEWAKDEKIAYQTINARAESLTDKPAFRTSFQRKRCLIPADSFYEWKGKGKQKQPMRIMLKSKNIFSIAGLYDTWVSPEGTRISTCTVVTTAANELVADIHERMPVILRPESEATWLDRRITNAEALSSLLKPYPADEMLAYPVSSRVGNVRNDDESCVEELNLLL
ncbi:SOS response-associated peptidase [Paenibacillus sp. SYP-B3998]|uniref:Abasic site processing protein n=1 Tax=Paenibacillus sp. SYP-B3998 TaxID=2678564 RepID=A0A6G3ZTE4_9BACL|nr:SOS response-associated peptidase [Paenibacillus sp. SYP-B3998]NEW05486.1 SOS response-associated peptidase [Paenibacillus sp. SYP-B3998]